MNRVPVALFVEGTPKGDVLADRGILDPGALWAVRDGTAELDRTCRAAHLPDETLQQRRLAGADRTCGKYESATNVVSQ